MADKKYEHIDEEKLKEVTGGMTMEDEEWVDNIIWESLENDMSWNDVVDKYFPLIEAYCEKANENRVNTLKVTPRDIDEHMQFKYFYLGEKYLNGERRPAKNKRR